mgnify:CR=1 FL=1
MNRKKKENAAQSTRQLMGIDGIKDYCIATRMGDLVFFIIKPTNISVLSDSSISARIYALLNVVKGQAEIEMLALNSKESFERNKNFYQERMGNEELPAIRRLLEQDSKHLDRIQVLMASSREVYIIIRLRSEKETDVFPYLSRIEQSINDNGFTTRRATEQDLKRMLGVYFEQNVTTEKFEDYDGDRWVIVGEYINSSQAVEVFPSMAGMPPRRIGGIHFGKESEKTCSARLRGGIHQILFGYDRPLCGQLHAGSFHLRQHLPLRMGTPGIPDQHG